MLADLREKAHDFAALFTPNEKIVAEYMLMLGEERPWREWQSKFPGMLPGAEPSLRDALDSADIDWWIDSYHITGKLERTSAELNWQLVLVGAEEG